MRPRTGSSAALPAAVLALLPACAGVPPVPPVPPNPPASQAAPVVERILAAAKSDSRAHDRLRHLCDVIGHRLSGSEGLDRAIAWAAETMRTDGLDAVRTEPVMVPKWVRTSGHGWSEAEGVVLKEPQCRPLQALALGGSVETPLGRRWPGMGMQGNAPAWGELEADVVAVRDWAGLEALGDRVKGKIVLFHHPMKPYEPGKDPGYGESVDYRVNGASRAAKQGAVGVLVCSATARSLGTPHTGMLRYEEGVPKIPAAALSPEDSAMLLRLFEAGKPIKVGMTLSCGTEADVPSANVVGEIRGSERPEEIVLLGAHLDSWDVGQGAHDDGGPCVAVMEAMRILKSLGLRPRRTVRAVLFTNEENGTAGGREYARVHGAEPHLLAIEADSGAFRPLGLGTAFPKPGMDDGARDRAERTVARLRSVLPLLAGVGAGRLTDGGGGADIAPLADHGVPLAGLEVDMATYFDIHHTHADTFDKVVKEDLDLCAGVLAAVAFVLADAEEQVPGRPPPPGAGPTRGGAGRAGVAGPPGGGAGPARRDGAARAPGR